MLSDELPIEKGIYALHLQLDENVELYIGALGEVDFRAGHYVYLGTAFGPGGVRARAGRHLRGIGKMHWHIDRLRRAACPLECWYVTIHNLDRGDWYEAEPVLKSYECRWSQALGAMPMVSYPVPGFGSSDCQCGCTAHLVLVDMPSDGNKYKYIESILIETLARSIHIEEVDLRHFRPVPDKGYRS